MTLRELSKVVGATCENPDTGEGCSAGDYDVELHPDCSSRGLFARVIAANGALLIDKAPPEDTVRRAMLSQGQIVCIQAIANAGSSASYYFVVTGTNFDGGKCSGTCDQSGASKIRWLVAHGSGPCRAVSSSRFDGDCATGWVRESNVEIINRN